MQDRDAGNRLRAAGRTVSIRPEQRGNLHRPGFTEKKWFTVFFLRNL